jgi:predicted enzyme related to lactoylglutathione lyase
MSVRYAHTNIIAWDWRQLAQFYQAVFVCTPLLPERDQSGAWLEQATGVAGAALQGVHLRLPGHGENGPTLEIYSYHEMPGKPEPRANRQGLGHLAFAVDDVSMTLQKVLEHGGSALGSVTTTHVAGVGHLTVVYATDPEGNILELQRWA